MDFTLLKQIYAAHSLSGKEGKRRKVVRDYVRKNIPGCTMFTDPAGNLFITRGQSDTYPCVAAHVIETCTDVYPHISEDDYSWGRYGHVRDYDLYDWIEDYLLYYPDATDEDIVAEFADCTRMDPSEIAAIAQEIRNIYYIDQPEEDKI
jgi:hypothetical protein